MELDIMPYCEGCWFFDPKNVWDVVCPSCGHCIFGRKTVRDAVRGWNDNARKNPVEQKYCDG